MNRHSAHIMKERRDCPIKKKKKFLLSTKCAAILYYLKFVKMCMAVQKQGITVISLKKKNALK